MNEWFNHRCLGDIDEIWTYYRREETIHLYTPPLLAAVGAGEAKVATSIER